MEQSSPLVAYGFRRAIISFIAILCVFLPVMSAISLNVAINDIRGNLGITLSKAVWVITAYTLASIIIVPFSSWLSRQLGRRNYFAAAVVVFTVSSFFCGNAVSLPELVIFVFLQGLGAGAMMVSSHTIITESWPIQRRTTAQMLFVLGWILGVTGAPALSGYIVDDYSWSFVFYFNIPGGLVAILLIFLSVKNGTYEKSEDWPGITSLAIGASALYLAFTRAQEDTWTSLFVIVSLLTGLAGILFYVRRQLSITSANGEITLLWNNDLRAGLMLYFIATLAITGASVMYIPLPGSHMPRFPLSWWQGTRTVIIILGLIALLIEKGQIALKYLIVTGMLLFAIYCYMSYSIVSTGAGSVEAIASLVVRSTAIALLSVSITTLAFSKLEGVQIGQGAALYNIVQQLGSAVGLTLMSAFANRQAALKRMDIANIVNNMSPETKRHIAELLSAKGLDTSGINYDAYAFTQINTTQTVATHSPYVYMLYIGGALLVCVPLVLYFLRKKDD